MSALARTSERDCRTRTTSENCTASESWTRTKFGYDNIYELLSVTQGGSTTESYTFDPVGNRLTSLGSAAWSYNTSNELNSRPDASYAFDYNGNTIVKTDGTGSTSYTWDYENRMTSVILPGSGGTVSFRYDPFGRRIYKSSSSGTSIFAYDNDDIVEETNAGGATVARYTQGPAVDEPLAMLRSSTTSYFQADGMGSITSLSSTSGALANIYGYDSFGNLVASSGNLVNSFRYTGREFDPETSLYYYRARYYDLQSGRFFSEDPYRWTAGINFYRYVRNRPTYFRDPSGKLNIASGFPPNCLKDLLDGIKILQDRIRTLPGCNCFFTSHGLHAPLDLLLASPLFTVNYDPQGNAEKNEKRRLAYVLPGDPFNIYLTPRGCASGPAHIAQDLAHEFAHISLGHASEYYNNHPLPENPDHALARQAEVACGFRIQAATTVVVTAP